MIHQTWKLERNQGNFLQTRYVIISPLKQQSCLTVTSVVIRLDNPIVILFPLWNIHQLHLNTTTLLGWCCSNKLRILLFIAALTTWRFSGFAPFSICWEYWSMGLYVLPCKIPTIWTTERTVIIKWKFTKISASQNINSSAMASTIDPKKCHTSQLQIKYGTFRFAKMRTDSYPAYIWHICKELWTSIMIKFGNFWMATTAFGRSWLDGIYTRRELRHTHVNRIHWSFKPVEQCYHYVSGILKL